VRLQDQRRSGRQQTLRLFRSATTTWASDGSAMATDSRRRGRTSQWRRAGRPRVSRCGPGLLSRRVRIRGCRGCCSGPKVDQPAPDPAQFGLPTEDDGSRDDCCSAGIWRCPSSSPTRRRCAAPPCESCSRSVRRGRAGSQVVAARPSPRPWRHTRGLPRRPRRLRRQRGVAEQRPRRVRPEVTPGAGVNGDAGLPLRPIACMSTARSKCRIRRAGGTRPTSNSERASYRRVVLRGPGGFGAGRGSV